MKAILLAAGMGTRLQPLSHYIPKCLVPIQGKPILAHWLEKLTNAGMSDCIINTHYLDHMVTEWIQASPFKDIVTIAYEDRLLGTAGTLIKHQDFIGEDPVLLIHADNICTAPIEDFIQAHNKRPREIDLTMMTFTTDTPQSCGIVELNDKGVVTAFHEKVANPPSSLANAAIYIIEAGIIKNISQKTPQPSDFSTEVIPNYLGKIFHYHNKKYHRDIGTPNSYIQALLDHPYDTPYQSCKSWQSVLKKNPNIQKSIKELLSKANLQCSIIHDITSIQTLKKTTNLTYLDASIPKNEYLEIIETLANHHLNASITLCIPALSEIPEHVQSIIFKQFPNPILLS